MKILNIAEKTIPCGSAMQNSQVSFKLLTGSAVAIVTDACRDGKQIIGYGFNSVSRYAPTSVLRDRMIPKIMNADDEDIYTDDHESLDPMKIYKLLLTNEKPGGHGDRAHAIGAIDMAVWDVIAKLEQKPLYRVLAERYNGGVYNEKIYTYAAGGYYYPDGTMQDLKDEIKGHLDNGFRDVKMKVGGAPIQTDLARIEAVLSELGNDGSRLMVDINGKFDLRQAIDFALAVKPYKLKWMEEPLDPLDYASHAALAEYYAYPMATGENLFSFAETRNLIRHAGLRADRDFVQVGPPLSYGLMEYLKIMAYMKDHGWAKSQLVPQGGNLFCIHIASALQLGGSENYPGVFQPFGGTADGTKIEAGYVKNPEAPGIGIELKSNLWDVMKDMAK